MAQRQGKYFLSEVNVVEDREIRRLAEKQAEGSDARRTSRKGKKTKRQGENSRVKRCYVLPETTGRVDY